MSPDDRQKIAYGKKLCKAISMVSFIEESLIDMMGKADVNVLDDDGYSALYRASGFSYAINVVGQLLKAGANTELVCKHNQTAIFNAVSNANVDIFNLLVLHGANVNFRTKGGITLLGHAISKSVPRMTRHVIELTEDIESPIPSLGITPFEYARSLRSFLGDEIAYDIECAIKQRIVTAISNDKNLDSSDIKARVIRL